MAVNDLISDFLTRIRNAQMANHRVVTTPSSNMLKSMTEILYDQGYIMKYKFDQEDGFDVIKIALKYNQDTKKPVIKKMKRVSKPGLRQYVSVSDIPRVINGYGIAILSTSKGVMTNKKAKEENVGGEVLCYIY